MKETKVNKTVAFVLVGMSELGEDILEKQGIVYTVSHYLETQLGTSVVLSPLHGDGFPIGINLDSTDPDFAILGYIPKIRTHYEYENLGCLTKESLKKILDHPDIWTERHNHWEELKTIDFPEPFGPAMARARRNI